MLSDRIKNYLKQQVGLYDQFSLQTRIYHTFCYLTIIGVTCIIPVKFILGLTGSAILATVLVVFLYLAFWLSRYKKQHRFSIVLTGIVINILFGLNYFFNGGIYGSDLLVIAFSYFAILTVTQSKDRNLWTVVNLCIFLLVVALDYFFPFLSAGSKIGRAYNFIDIGCTYFILILLMRVIIPYIINNYNYAKGAAETKADQLIRINDEKNKLISIISHDIRGPLSSIQTYLELLVDEEFSQEENDRIKDKLLQSTRQTLEMLNNVLVWSKDQMTTPQVLLREVQLAELLLGEQQLYRNIAEAKNIILDYSIEDVTVLADQHMLQLIVRNLLSNAIKFTSSGGRIVLLNYISGENCIVEVSDSGTGTPVELDDSIFQFSAHTTYGTNNEKGVGLGLVLCKEYIEKQNGRIWYKNHLVSGTSFYVQIPLAG